jgi:hypothetical protein
MEASYPPTLNKLIDDPFVLSVLGTFLEVLSLL